MSNKMDKSSDKISAMFNNIAPAYDRLNHILSLGIDRCWRKKVASEIKKMGSKSVLDVATGTGDLAITIARGSKDICITGSDFSEGMLEIGRAKVAKASLEGQIAMEWGDALDFKYQDDSFDAVTVAFGVRNFNNLSKGLSEMYRVVKDGGRLYVIELTMPENSFVKLCYNIYFTKVLPFFGRMVSKDNFAYTYLPQSVVSFTSREEFIKELYGVGFKSADYKNLTLGIATLYIAKK